MNFFQKYWKVIIGILFAIAVLLGLSQRQYNPFASRTTVTHFSAGHASLPDYYQKGLELADQKTPAQTVSFLAVGDIMLSRNVGLEIQKQNDVNYPFRQMADVLKSTNFNFGNLETPVAQDKGIVGGHSLIFNSPQDYIKTLTDYNFNILNLANNHAMDQGFKGLDFTNIFLGNIGIKHMGTGQNLSAAWQPAIMEQNGLKICFVGASYASVNDGGKTTNTFVARMDDLDNLKLAIQDSKSLCDFVVATMHGGVEYTRKPNNLQTAFAHAAIDDGADLVIGAHPHWVQTIERYCPNSATILHAPSPILGEGAWGEVKCSNPKYIFYSLGNFIFDQAFSQDVKEGLTLKIQISKNQQSNLQGPRTPAQINSIELLPVIIENSQPRPATADETKKILQKIGETTNLLK